MLLYNNPVVAALDFLFKQLSNFMFLSWRGSWQSYQQVLTLVLAVIVSSQAQSSEDKPTLLVSIKPLALIAQEIAGDKVRIDTLLPITASPHDYPLKASDHKRLHKADLILWVGAELESFLAKPLKNIPAHKVMSTYILKGIYWPTADIHHPHKHAHTNQRGQDPHLWLDPRNAVIIAQALTNRLSELMPTAATQFAANNNNFSQRMLELDMAIAQSLKPIQAVGFAVHHEGYAHFVAHYELHQVGYVTYTPERRPGAKHLQELRNVLKEEGKCLFMEPQASKSSVQELARSLNLRTGLLDPIGNDDVTSYAQLLSAMREQFLTCLADWAH